MSVAVAEFDASIEWNRRGRGIEKWTRQNERNGFGGFQRFFLYSSRCTLPLPSTALYDPPDAICLPPLDEEPHARSEHNVQPDASFRRTRLLAFLHFSFL